MMKDVSLYIYKHTTYSRFVVGGSAEVIVAVAADTMPSAPFVLSANTVLIVPKL